MVNISILLSLFLLGSCSTSPVKKTDAQQVEESNQWNYRKRTSDEQGLITIIRDSGFVGSACDTYIFINKEKTAKIGTSEFVDIIINPGSYSLGIEPNSPCVGKYYEIPVLVSKNEHKTFRIGVFKSKLVHKRNNISIEAVD